MDIGTESFTGKESDDDDDDDDVVVVDIDVSSEALLLSFNSTGMVRYDSNDDDGGVSELLQLGFVPPPM